MNANQRESEGIVETGKLLVIEVEKETMQQIDILVRASYLRSFPSIRG
jgi:hypothetical protein